MAFAHLLLVGGLLQGAVASGSWRDADDFGPDSHIHALARFSMARLKDACAASNSLVCARMGSETELVQVKSAQTQVVAGKNYLIEAETSVGNLHLVIFEQSWSNTLKITEAKLTLKPVGMSFAMVSGPLIEEELALDAREFVAFAHPCDGGRVWNECGSACDSTCAEPTPMCTRECVAKCACPADKPVWQENQCIAQSECPAAAPEVASRPVGGMTAAAAQDITAGSKIHRLASFSLAGLKAHCAAQNGIMCNDGLSAKELHHVVSAQTQVVAGINYVIEARTKAGDDLHLRIFEQSWTSTLEITEAILTRPVQPGLLGRASGNLLSGDGRLALDAAAFEHFQPKLSPIAMLSSAIMVGGAPGLGGGHYTGSDAQLFAAAAAAGNSAKPTPTPTADPTNPAPVVDVVFPIVHEDTSTQWWIFTFFVLGVVLVAGLTLVARRMQRDAKADEEPINEMPRSSSAEVDAAQERKGDSTMV